MKHICRVLDKQSVQLGLLIIVMNLMYCQISNIRHTLVGNKIGHYSDVVGASPVYTAPTTSPFSTKHLMLTDWAKTTARRDEKHLSVVIWCALY